MNIIAEFMDMVSKLKNPPKYHLSFNVKDIKGCKSVVSKSSLNSQDMYMEKEKSFGASNFDMAKSTGVQDTIQTIFTPEDVEITNIILFVDYELKIEKIYKLTSKIILEQLLISVILYFAIK